MFVERLSGDERRTAAGTAYYVQGTQPQSSPPSSVGLPGGGAEILCSPAYYFKTLMPRYWTVILAVLLGAPPTVTTTS